MRAFTAKQNQSQPQVSPDATRPNVVAPKGNLKVQPRPDLADSSPAEATRLARPDGGFENKSTARFAHDFARIPVRAQAPIQVQPKLMVNLPGDSYEQEADRIAEQVMRRSEQKRQSACACGSKCPKCQAKQSGKHAERLQTKRIGSSDREETDIPPIVHEVLAAPGQPLDAATRAFMEPRFGHDFSHVRIHTGKQAAESTHAMNAMAYTVGSGIVFGAGQYSPRTRAGQQLLAHELVHTLQQSNGAASGIDRVSDSHDLAEQEADRNASAVMAGRQAQVSMAAGAQTLHRQPLPNAAQPRRVPPRLLGREDLDSFALNSATLTKDQKGQLAVFAHTLKDLLQEYPDANVQITGHTDASGDESYNEQLGQQRADAVADFLIKAGVPADPIVTLSAGESELRVKTEKPEPRNRRAEVRFEPKPKSFRAPAPTKPTEPTKSTTTVPRPEQLCTDNPNLSVCQQGPGPNPPGGTAAQPGGGPAGCGASAVGGYDKLPAALRKVIERKGIDPQVWFEDPSLDRSALTAIYNRMCQYGLWDFITEITEVTPGEPLVGDSFAVAGLTTEVHFTGQRDAMKKALGASPHFCEAVGIGNKMHQFPSWREISDFGSLHITVEPGEINAHIDLRSPTPEGTSSGLCTNDPTPSNLDHILNELGAEKIRDLTGLPGVQVTPKEEPPPAVPPGAAGFEPFSGSTGFDLGGILKLLGKAFLSQTSIKLHPTSKRPRPRSSTPPLPPDVEQMLDQQIPSQVALDALVPVTVKEALAKATRASDQAGPDEEAKLNAAREAAQERFDSFAIDAHEFAKELARKMAQAAHTGSPGFMMDLGSSYARLSPDDNKVLLANVRDIAIKVRAILLKSTNVNVKAGGVSKIALFFGAEGYWDINF